MYIMLTPFLSNNKNISACLVTHSRVCQPKSRLTLGGLVWQCSVHNWYIRPLVSLVYIAPENLQKQSSLILDHQCNSWLACYSVLDRACVGFPFSHFPYHQASPLKTDRTNMYSLWYTVSFKHVFAPSPPTKASPAPFVSTIESCFINATGYSVTLSPTKVEMTIKN